MSNVIITQFYMTLEDYIVVEKVNKLLVCPHIIIS